MTMSTRPQDEIDRDPHIADRSTTDRTRLRSNDFEGSNVAVR
ncbi:hypothetical protein [Rhodococcus opacus]|nr:hypothetical protein [Rhodococcus opacus]